MKVRKMERKEEEKGLVCCPEEREGGRFSFSHAHILKYVATH